jgi:hypothetical protein
VTAIQSNVLPFVIARAGVIFLSGAAYSIATGALVWTVPAAASDCATQIAAPYADATQRVVAVACKNVSTNMWTIYSLDAKTGRFVNAPYRFYGASPFLASYTRVGANTVAFITAPNASINTLVNYDIPSGRVLWSRPWNAPSDGVTLIVPGDANWTLAEASNLDAFDRTGRKVWSVPASAVNGLLNFKTITGAYRTIGLDTAGHAVLWDQGTGQQLWRSPHVLADNPVFAQATLASPSVVAITTFSGVVWGIDVARAVPEIAYHLTATIVGGGPATVIPIATLPGAPVPPFLIVADPAQNVYKIDKSGGDKSGAVSLVSEACGTYSNFNAYVPPTLNFVVISWFASTQMFLI